MSSWRVVTTGLALVLCAILALPDPGYGRSGARTGSQSRGGSHLYVLLGLGNNSPGLSEFGSRMAQCGIPTTVRNYGDWPALAQEAIQQYKDGWLRSIMIVGHSLIVVLFFIALTTAPFHGSRKLGKCCARHTRRSAVRE